MEEQPQNKLVWAKMRGFPIWPGKICTPEPNLMKVPPKPKGKLSKWIYFFGSNNYSWIEESNIQPYSENRENFVKNIKNVALRKAVKLIEDEKSKMNAESSSESKDEDTGTACNAQHQNDESSDIEPTNSVGTSAGESSEKKKSESITKTKRRTSNNGDFAEASSSKRMWHSPRNEPIIHIMSELEPDIPTLRRSNMTAARIAINRPLASEEPPQTSLNIPQSPKLQNIVASDKTFGFLGVGIMGSAIVKNLLISGHKMIIWDPDSERSRKLEEIGAQVAMTPVDVAEQAYITFSCVSDPLAAKNSVLGNCGITALNQHFDGKGYVEMTGIDCGTSQDIDKAIISKSGRYLVAQIQGSRIEAEKSTLVILAAGDRTLFDECQSCFKAMSEKLLFLDNVENALNMYLILQTVRGVFLGGVAEAFALAKRANLQQNDLLEVLQVTTTASPYIIEICRAIINQEDYAVHHPLKHMQKDLQLALSLSNQVLHAMPITAATNEIFKFAKQTGCSYHDASAVYSTLK